ncbi:putative RNA-dependent RNA polymerase 1 [Cyphellophora attinorum]|uniref:RNA-dependent RNA polymerase n=1 Tax=Cyphellophora attinorum TaxID=1664694 RepID=A0A0N1HCU0_9EURO|nr:putative RNA-dependent RNA polymerase 1 [Phialophora attinorum]KPI41804.1 putative RNA-dependent RNA polymerase 1 [Phialophora attinorum]
MDVFVRNIDAKLTKAKVELVLRPVLEELDIPIFEITKPQGKPFAFITFPSVAKGQRLLDKAASTPRLFVSLSGKLATFQRSKKAPDPLAVKALIRDEKEAGRKAWQRSARDAAKTDAAKAELPALRRATITHFRCGQWETSAKTQKRVFVPYHEQAVSGTYRKTEHNLLLQLSFHPGLTHEIEIDRAAITSIAVSTERGMSTLAITLWLQPKIFERSGGSEDDLADLLQQLGLTKFTPAKKKIRCASLPGRSVANVGGCMTYMLVFSGKIGGLQQNMASLMSFQVPVITTSATMTSPTLGDLPANITALNADIARLRFGYSVRFQIQALWTNGTLSPGEVARLLPDILHLQRTAGEKATIKALKWILLHFAPTDASPDSAGNGLAAAKASLDSYGRMGYSEKDVPQGRDEVFIHRVTVTPTGLRLFGPELTAANRILRKYREHAECFIRVVFTDEDEERVAFSREIDNDAIFMGRFLTLLQNGIDIAGFRFEFLGFSHSSLRSQTCWFMRPFIHDGQLMYARTLIDQLGDFSAIRCPAKCAARIGQAFSDTTRAIRVDSRVVSEHDDVRSGRHVFTDGCGTISPAVWSLLKGNYARGDPTSYQIRYKGSKGMLTLDTRLQGQQMRLRHSMIKYSGSPLDDVEICGHNGRPLPLKLNRQLIKILEDLGVEAKHFMVLQNRAIERLRLSALSREMAIEFIMKNFSDGSGGLPRLLKSLRLIGVDLAEDDFLREILGALIQIELRELKYRTRILVENGLTLYGISDETQWLQEGQVFVTATEDDEPEVITGRLVVTRSPALHPGDVQVVTAVEPPKDSPLWNLRNCVVFNQKGARDLPSMLSGGDLDGDLYHVIYDKELMPKRLSTAAAYEPAEAIDIGRPVTANDMTKFFIDFMQNDQLGRIATLHQVIADTSEEGVFDKSCLLLSELHSTAVDFSKSGVAVDVTKIPAAKRYRPDFMAPSASTKVERGIKRETLDAPLGDSSGGYRYYESDKVLGQLFRAIDEDLFFQDIEDDTTSIFSTDASNNVLAEILDWARSRISQTHVNQHLQHAREVRDYYESIIYDFMSYYAIRRTDALTEKEVFIGTIMGRQGSMSKKQREWSEDMKARFGWELRDIKGWMQERVLEDEEDITNMAVACLHVAVHEQSELAKKEELKSFGWFAAGLCMPEIISWK